MKSKFWASVIAWIGTFVTVLIAWFLFGKPTITDNTAISMIGSLAIIALHYSLRNDLLRKGE